jgi:pimeloyl-ACP methyl ester carboxylesterase
MNRIIFTGGQVFDGTGVPPVPADVVVRGDRVETVRPGGGTVAEPGDQVVDCAGATVMPGLVESHCHLTFPSALGHIDPSFNPPLDVSFFRHMPTPDEHLAIAGRNAKILLDHGFTSAYSAGSLTPVPTEVRLREAIAAGATPSPRLRAASFERDNNPVQMGPDGPRPKKTGPDSSVPGLAREASPVSHASAAAPPVLLMHGAADDLVPPAQSIRLAEALHAAGATAELELVPGATHMWNGASDVDGIVRRSVEFLRTVTPQAGAR